MLFKKFLPALWLLWAFACSTPPAENKTEKKDMPAEETSFTFYIGGYSTDSLADIYKAELSDKGIISKKKPLAFSGNPSYLALNKNKTVLFAVNEYFDKEGDISVFDLKNDSLKLAGSIKSGGLYPCYITLQNDQIGLVANYGGSVSKFTFQGNSFEGSVQTITHEGSSVNPDRQNGPHAHTTAIHPNQNWAFAADLGTDEIIVYDIENWTEVSRIKLEAGSGPRHITFRNSKQGYVINELNSTINLFSVNEAGEIHIENTVSTLPEGIDEENYPAGIHIHPNGKYLYTSNRGYNSIAYYEINNDGSLKLIGTFSDKISWPRSFAISPDGNFLVVANQKSNSVTVLELNNKTGEISGITDVIETPTPTHILFE